MPDAIDLIEKTQQRHPKVLEIQYLLHDDEPSSSIFNDLPWSEVDDALPLPGSSYQMKQELRRTAQRMRNSYN
jgi:hypothetical protein